MRDGNANDRMRDAFNKAERVMHSHANSGGHEWPDPDMTLVADDRMPAPKFDWDAVPPSWPDWLRGMSEDTGAPVDYLFANLLGIASGVTGNARRVSPWGGWVEQPHLWIANVGNPSSMKTPALTPFKAPCREIENEEMPAHDEALRQWETRRAAAEAASDNWKRKVKEAVDGGKEPPEKPTDADGPKRPYAPRILIADSTTEEAANLLAHNPRGLILTRSELAGWLGQLDRYGGAGADRAFYLESWDGGSHLVDRVKHKGEPVRVPFASLAIIGTIQPERLREAFRATDDGLIARFLYIWPEPIPPRRPVSAGHHQRAAFLQAALSRLRDLEMNRDAAGESLPMVVHLDSEAALEVVDTVRKEISEANKIDAGLMAGWRGKNGGRLLRIALVLELIQWAAHGNGEAPVTISAEMIRRAADFLDYATAMMQRCLGELALTDAQRDAAKLARLISGGKPETINERATYQSQGFHALRDTPRRKAAFAELAASGWVKHQARGDWTINPKLLGAY